MKYIIIGVFFLILLSPILSAEIVLNSQPNEVYNLGDSVSIPITIKALNDISSSLNLDLVCNGNEINFYRNGISLSYGEELKLVPAPSLLLTKQIIGGIKGVCKIRASLGENSILTNQFKISDLITFELKNKPAEFTPGQSYIIDGTAIKENGKIVDGFIETEIILSDNINNTNSTNSIKQMETITKGIFSVNLTIPKNAKAGSHLLNVNIYEKDSNGNFTNKGYSAYNININQIPTSIEIIFENNPVEPGNNLGARVILHDQTGEKIDSNAILTLKNFKDKILEQKEITTGELFEYPINYNTPPGKWKIFTVSNKLSNEAEFNISEKQAVDISLINKTIIVTNIGNVQYCNKAILLKIGNESLNLNPCLSVDQTVTYLLTAPDGEYQVEIINNGESLFTQSASLTGNSIDARESKSIVSYMAHPVAWIFLILILLMVAILVFKKGYKRSFVGGIVRNKSSPIKKEEKISIQKGNLTSPKNKAILLLSIKGNKQDATVVNLKIKNKNDLSDGKGGVNETIKKIVDLSENSKACVYENNEDIIFIFAPVKTKTFKNERSAIIFSQTIDKILSDHNRLFKQKIDYGLGLNYGEIIAKEEANGIEFMAIKNLIIGAKKTADMAKEEILLNKDFQTRLGSDIKTEKHLRNKVEVYKITQLIDRESNRAFIGSFLKRLEKK